MKKHGDPRHNARVATVKELFAGQFTDSNDRKESSQVAEIRKKQAEIDTIIEKSAPAFPIKQLAPIDLAILQLAIFELVFAEYRQPFKAVIDEAVEIAKEYGGTSSASFINGVLGTVVKTIRPI